jgi:hypothetical protein
VRGRIHASVVEVVSLLLSESAATHFSLVISKSTGTMCANETKRQLGKQFR